MKQPSIKILMLIPGVLFLFGIVALLIPRDALNAFSGKVAPTGSIIVYVEDGNTKKPLQNASVVIPEMGQSFATDEYGKTDRIRAPILSDAEYEGILPKPWGEITLLVYKDGYVDCAIFHVNVWENQTRNGPVVLMFPATADTAGQPFTLTEGPNRIWVNELLNRCRPDEVH